MESPLTRITDMNTLPIEVISIIHEFFDPETFLLSPRVCRKWKRLHLALKKKLYKSIVLVTDNEPRYDKKNNSSSYFCTSNGWKMFHQITFQGDQVRWLWDLKHGVEIHEGKKIIWKY